jgi:eukaryotic-like serine/threonine-protein kinase
VCITDVLILPDDVQIMSVADLPAEVRRDLVWEEGEQAVIRPGTRAPLRILDAEGVALLRLFRPAKTIGAAVVAYCRAHGGDPKAVVQEAYPLLRRLIDSHLLVPAGSALARQIAPSFRQGEQAAGCTVIRCVQSLADSELFCVTTDGGVEAAMKMARPDGGEAVRAALAHEGAVLRHLDGRVNPPLLAEGDLEGRPYLLTGWCPGEAVAAQAARLRSLPAPMGRKRLLALCCGVADAYAHLHAQGVVHGDIHPRNMLVGAGEQVTIIDYGYAHLPVTGAPGRVGVPEYVEPEYAQACLEGRRPPGATAEGEQYALAALLYELLTGEPYLRFLPDQEAIWRQIVQEAPLPFADRGTAPWPDVEALLARALRKSPGERYGSVAEFAGGLRAVLHRSGAPLTVPEAGARLAKAVLERLAPGGLTLADLTAPVCSVYYGAAGLAYALCRMAGARGDALLLSHADVWITRAEQAIGSAEAFHMPEAELPPGWASTVTPYHQAAGVHLVRALVSQALGDVGGMRRATEAYVAAVQAPCANPDLTLGRAGVLLGCAMLLEALPPVVDTAALKAQGDRVMESLWDGTVSTPNEYLGVAHGWAGILCATLRWCAAAGCSLPPGVGPALARLEVLARRSGSSASWPLTPGGRAAAEGWCHGSAGYVWLWTSAHRLLRQESYLQLAVAAGQHVWDHPAGNGTLCCGLAGQAYAMLHLYRYTGEAHWLEKAGALAEGAAQAMARSGAGRRDSLFKGEVGVAVLAVDLEQPEGACFPLFGAEGWVDG